MIKMSDTFKFLILIGLVFWGCTSTKVLKQDAIGLKADQKSMPFQASEGSYANTITEPFGMGTGRPGNATPGAITPLIPHANDSLIQTIEVQKELQDLKDNEVEIPEYIEPVSPVAQKIVENYLNSKNKEPGGHCLNVSKTRFEKAYEEIYGHSVYEDLPDTIATTYYTPKEVFDYIYVSAQGIHEGWRSLPITYRGKGDAGAVAYAGMGTLVDSLGIWSGQLSPGALMQVWKHREDYEKVVAGTNEKDFDPFGHSFIFMGYTRDENNDIIGIRIADQGYQSQRTLLPEDYEVWWAVNLII